MQLTVHMTSTKSKIWVSGKCIRSERPKSVAVDVSSVEDLIGREVWKGEVPSVTVNLDYHRCTQGGDRVCTIRNVLTTTDMKRIV